MSFAFSRKRKRWEHRCDHCTRLLGVGNGLGDAAVMDPRAGYVLGVGRRTEQMLCGDRGCRRQFVHPLACSDACEDALLKSWPRMDVEYVMAEDWAPDFRDADIVCHGPQGTL